MQEAKTMKTPMSSSIKLDKDEKGKSIDSTMYRGMIGSLLYLTTSRPDIMYSEDWRLGFQFWTAFSSSRESWLPLGHRASTQLSCLSLLSRRLTKKRGLTPPCLAPGTYGIGGPIISTIRGVEIHLDLENICRIFDIVRLDSKCSNPLGVHDDDAYNLMLQEQDTRTPLWSLPHQSIDFEAPNIYDTYDDQSMGRMKFEKALDVSWVRRAERPPTQARGQGQAHPGVEKEAEIREMEGGVDPQRPSTQLSFTKPPHTEIPPHQTPHAPDHAPWMDLSSISYLGTRMEEFVVMIERIEDRLESQHEEMMAYLRSVFPPPPSHLDFLETPFVLFLCCQRGDI
ncbi:hypothetical protein AAG906_010515 [Vitis piasezkii]